MSFLVVLTNQAKNDLISIFNYIFHDLKSPKAAKDQLNNLEKAIYSLGEMPERYRLYEQEKWKKRNLRIMSVNNYLVFYIISEEENTVKVMRVMYGARDIDYQLNIHP